MRREGNLHFLFRNFAKDSFDLRNMLMIANAICADILIYFDERIFDGCFASRAGHAGHRI